MVMKAKLDCVTLNDSFDRKQYIGERFLKSHNK